MSEAQLEPARVMGILNVTADSFSDGGRYLDVDAAVAHARSMIDEGADIIDIGGESTRPGAEPVALDLELSRVMPVVEALAGESVTISLDTSKPEVMREGVALGARMINDVRALRMDGALEAARRATVDHGCEVVLMHMQGTPETMQKAPTYVDVVNEVCAFLEDRTKACVDFGLAPDRLLVDPGFGFGKTTTHNLELLDRLGEIVDLGFPVVAGLSRKRMFGELLAAPDGSQPEPIDRVHGSVAAAQIAADRGAQVVRVHDVRPTVHALNVLHALHGVRS